MSPSRNLRSASKTPMPPPKEALKNGNIPSFLSHFNTSTFTPVPETASPASNPFKSTQSAPGQDLPVGPAFNTRRARRQQQETPDSVLGRVPKQRHAPYPDVPTNPRRRAVYAGTAPNPAPIDAEDPEEYEQKATPQIKFRPVNVPRPNLRPDASFDRKITGQSLQTTPTAEGVDDSYVIESPTRRGTRSGRATPGRLDLGTSSRNTANTSSGAEAESIKEKENIPTEDGVLKDIDECLSGLIGGEISYGTALPDMPLPQISITGIGPISLPLSNEQLTEIRTAAQMPFAGRLEGDLPFTSDHMITSHIYEQNLLIANQVEWDAYIGRLTLEAGERLGFGNEAANIRFKARKLWLWEKNSVLREYTKPHEEDAVQWAGTVLVIIDQNCKAGEICIWNQRKGVVVDSTAHKQFMVAHHNSAVVDVLPLTEGYRLALSYELYLKNNNLRREGLNQFMVWNEKKELKITKSLKEWAVRIKHGELDNFPLIHVLDGEYHQHELNINSVNGQDRAAAQFAIKAMRDISLTPQLGYTLGTYFVLIKATSKNYSVGSRSRYSIEFAASLDGAPKPDVKEIVIDPTGVIQRKRFAGGETRHITNTMNTTTKTCACMMLVWHQ